jgi:hypothetical protein
MFAEHPLHPCTVPAFTAYVRADTGAVYGCNMLAYVQPAIGDLHAEDALTVWSGDLAQRLRAACSTGRHPECRRCDPGSREMNHVLRQLAARRPAPLHDHPADRHPQPQPVNPRKEGR